MKYRKRIKTNDSYVSRREMGVKKGRGELTPYFRIENIETNLWNSITNVWKIMSWELKRLYNDKSMLHIWHVIRMHRNKILKMVLDEKLED